MSTIPNCSCDESIKKIENILKDYLDNIRSVETKETEDTKLYAIMTIITFSVVLILCSIAFIYLFSKR